MNKYKHLKDESHTIKKYVLDNYQRFYYGHDLWNRVSKGTQRSSINDMDIGEYWFQLYSNVGVR